MIRPRILNIRPVEQGALRALVTLQIGPLVIYQARYIQQDGQRAYVSPPQEVVEGPGGQRRYIPLLKWPDEWKQPILEAVVAALAENRDGQAGAVDTEIAKTASAKTEFGTEVRQRAGLGITPADIQRRNYR